MNSPKTRNPIRRMYEWVLGWSEHRWALPALFILAFIEAIFFPIPPDVLLIALVLGQRSRWITYGIVTSVGSVLGGVGGYYLGVASSGWAEAIIDFYRQRENMQMVAEAFGRNAFIAIWTAGFSPIPYKVFTVYAGICHEQVSVWTLVGASLTSRPLRFFLVAGILYRFGKPAKDFIDRYFNLLTILLTLGVVAGFLLIPKLMS